MGIWAWVDLENVMSRLRFTLQGLCAILALLAFVVVPTGTSSAGPEPGESTTPPPHPAEVALLDELAAWSEEPAEHQPSFEIGMFEAGVGAATRATELAGVPYAEILLAAAENHSVDPLLLAAIVEVESRFDPRAVSPVGARGLMQLMPAHAAADPFDPAQNVDAGARYLGRLLERYDADLQLALAAYNAGPANVSRFGGVPPFRETRRYIEKVTRLYRQRLESAWAAEGRAVPERGVEVVGLGA